MKKLLKGLNCFVEFLILYYLSSFEKAILLEPKNHLAYEKKGKAF